MKKIGILLLTLALGGLSFAAYIAPSSSASTAPKASELYIPMGNGTHFSLMDLSQLRVKDYQKLTGKHLNLFQKISFKMTQKKLKKAISADGTVNSQKLANAMASGDLTQDFNGGWFVLGILLPLIGVLLSYVVPGDEAVRKNRQKWAWLGLGVVVVIGILALIL